MNYREKRRQDCNLLFSGFQPDLSSCRKPEIVLAILEMAKDGFFSHEIAERLGTTAKAVQKTYRRYGFPVLQNFAPPLREDRHGWKGGVKEAKGYLYSRTPGHPHASKHGGYVAVHRLVAEEKIGRYLLPTEVVDHIDGDIRNNHPDNLRVFQSNAEHLAVTLKGRCPDWSDEGKSRLSVARAQPRRTWKGRSIEPILSELGSDAGQ